MPLDTDAQKAVARARKHSFGPMGDILKLLADAAEIANATTMSISADGQKAVARAKAESFGDDEDVRKLLAAVAEGLAAGGGGGGADLNAYIRPNSLPTLTTSDPVDLLMQATTKAQIATAAGLGTGDTPTFTSVIGTNGVVGVGFVMPGVGSMWGISPGVIALRDVSGSDFGRLVLGSATNAFPALKRVGAGFEVRLADDSAPASIAAASFIVTGGVVDDATAARTLALADSGKYIRFTNAGTATITVPTNAVVAFPVGTEIILRRHAGPLAILNPGVTVNNAALIATIAAHGNVALKKVATDTWDAI